MSRPFTDVVGELAGGQTFERLNEAMAEVVSAVREVGKPGAVTLTLKIKPNGYHGIAVADEVATKVPQPPRGETLFFTDADGGLHRNDPRQQDLPLRRVDDERKEA